MIHIGTKSPTKTKAIIDIAAEYPLLKNSDFQSFKTESCVSDQPMTLEETISGAQNRAKNVFNECDYAFGIESGIMPIPGSKTGYMDVTVCAIYDGKEFHLGMASLFEYPTAVTKLVVEKNMEISTAFKEAGLTAKEKIGYEEGVIGFLTKGRLPIIEYYKQAIRTALIHLENKELFYNEK
ncbi:MAG: inosine/xanthosine triphosphatase [Patescibacteria group bacterium]